MLRSVYIPSGKSCLFANINIIASRISLSFIILCNSCLASSIRSLSAQSTTNIRPCVPAHTENIMITVTMTV